MVFALAELPASAEPEVRRVVSHGSEANHGDIVDVRVLARVGQVWEQISALTSLQDGWAGNGTQRISKRTAHRANTAFVVLTQAKPTIDSPSIVPAPDGVIQLEWHTLSFDLEIAATEDMVDVYLTDVAAGQTHNFPDLRTNGDLRQAVARIARLI